MTDVQGLGWLENTVCCAVAIHSWGNSKQVKAADVSQYDGELAQKVAEKTVVLSKKLLVCPEYKAITSRDSFAGIWFREHSVPSLFKRGVYAVPTAVIDDWIVYLDQYSRDREQLVSDFGFAFDQAVLEAEHKLGALFRAEEYPFTSEVVSKFSVQVRYLELGIPGKLALIAPDTFAKAQEELRQTVNQGKAYIEALLCQEVTDLTQGLYQALQGLDDGTLKRFHESHITKVQEWAALFLDARNVTDDAELAAVVQKLGHCVAGIQTEAVKKFAFVREPVKQALNASLVDLKALMAQRSTRHIDLED